MLCFKKKKKLSLCYASFYKYLMTVIFSEFKKINSVYKFIFIKYFANLILISERLFKKSSLILVYVVS